MMGAHTGLSRLSYAGQDAKQRSGSHHPRILPVESEDEFDQLPKAIVVFVS